MNGPSGLSHLSSRILTGNAGISHLQFLLSMSSADDAKVIERIISKDLKCGASESTANKIWPNLIHEYPCMLCTPFDEKLINKMKFPAMVQLKMDGMRFNAIVKDGKCEFRSRNGKEINLLENLEQQF
jgi:ATP-dependent DNA ligase